MHPFAQPQASSDGRSTGDVLVMKLCFPRRCHVGYTATQDESASAYVVRARTGDVFDVECGLYGTAAPPPPLVPRLLAAPPTGTCGVSFPSSVTIWHRSQDGAVVIHRAFRHGCRRFAHAEAGRSCFEWCSSIRVAGATVSPANNIRSGTAVREASRDSLKVAVGVWRCPRT